MTQSADLGALPNVSGFEFRSRLNTALKALASFSSGTAPPPVTEPFMLWIDQSTSPATARLRSAANDAWAAAGVMREDGTIAWAGSVPSPASLVTGDLLAWDGSAWVRLAAAAAGQTLRANGAGVLPSWQAGETLLSSVSLASGAANSGAIPAGAVRIVVGLSAAIWSAGSMVVRAISGGLPIEASYSGCVSRVDNAAVTALSSGWQLSRGESGVPHYGTLVIERMTAPSATSALYVATSLLGGARTHQMAGRLFMASGSIEALHFTATTGDVAGGTAYIRYSV